MFDCIFIKPNGKAWAELNVAGVGKVAKNFTIPESLHKVLWELCEAQALAHYKEIQANMTANLTRSKPMDKHKEDGFTPSPYVIRSYAQDMETNTRLIDGDIAPYLRKVADWIESRKDEREAVVRMLEGVKNDPCLDEAEHEFIKGWEAAIQAIIKKVRGE